MRGTVVFSVRQCMPSTADFSVGNCGKVRCPSAQANEAQQDSNRYTSTLSVLEYRRSNRLSHGAPQPAYVVKEWSTQ